MHSRREFLNITLMGAAGAAYASGMLHTAAAAAQQDSTPPPLRSKLLEVLKSVDKPAQTVKNLDGTTVVLLPYGGRVLGLYAPNTEENFYWTHPALNSTETARTFYASKDWHNSGGDRTWLAPEVDIFLPDYPKTETYFQPRELDPGNYTVVTEGDRVRMVNELTVKLSRSGQSVMLRISKSVGAAINPLRFETNLDQQDVVYAGYTQYTSLEMLEDKPKESPLVGLWNLVQMPHGGDLLIPTYSRTEPKLWFGKISPDDLIVGDRLIRYKMRASGEHKLGVRAIATTGRVGYLYSGAGKSSLIVRNFRVNPSGEYVDAPWKDPGDLGYSTQACNVNSALGAFSELEYHIPAIGGKSGMGRCDDEAQVWAFRGPTEQIVAVARCLLSPEV
ncbi:MAG TPA: hypothetical protein PLI09_22860 [Candidatus Hydrogenedentes bacterium]|nr:hypothetical protein [Candidatus Hydrogenedentota bacterium]